MMVVEGRETHVRCYKDSSSRFFLAHCALAALRADSDLSSGIIFASIAAFQAAASAEFCLCVVSNFGHVRIVSYAIRYNKRRSCAYG